MNRLSPLLPVVRCGPASPAGLGLRGNGPGRSNTQTSPVEHSDTKQNGQRFVSLRQVHVSRSLSFQKLTQTGKYKRRTNTFFFKS